MTLVGKQTDAQTQHSLWLNDSAMLLFRLQGAENKDHCPCNTPVARLAASATICFVEGHREKETKRKKRSGQEKWERETKLKKDGHYREHHHTGQHIPASDPIFWVRRSHYLTWPWPAFSHLSSACIHQEYNEHLKQQEDRRKSYTEEATENEEHENKTKKWYQMKREAKSTIMSCVILTLHPNVSLRVSCFSTLRSKLVALQHIFACTWSDTLSRT